MKTVYFNKTPLAIFATFDEAINFIDALIAKYGYPTGGRYHVSTIQP